MPQHKIKTVLMVRNLLVCGSAVRVTRCHVTGVTWRLSPACVTASRLRGVSGRDKLSSSPATIISPHSLLLSAPSTTFSSFADGASCNTEFTNFFFYWISHMLIKFKSSSSSQSEVQLMEVRAAMAKLAHGREIRIKVECVSVFKSHV